MLFIINLLVILVNYNQFIVCHKEKQMSLLNDKLLKVILNVNNFTICNDTVTIYWFMKCKSTSVAVLKVYSVCIYMYMLYMFI